MTAAAAVAAHIQGGGGQTTIFSWKSCLESAAHFEEGSSSVKLLWKHYHRCAQNMFSRVFIVIKLIKPAVTTPFFTNSTHNHI